MTSRHPFQRAGTVWRVIGRTVVDGVEVTLRLGGFAQTCGHYHVDQAEAEACPWEPPVAPGTVYAGRVLEVRDDRDDDRKPEQGVLFDLPARTRPLRQERWA